MSTSFVSISAWTWCSIISAVATSRQPRKLFLSDMFKVGDRAYTWCASKTIQFAAVRFGSIFLSIFSSVQFGSAITSRHSLVIIHFHSMARLAFNWSQLITLQMLFNEKYLLIATRDREGAPETDREGESERFAQLEAEKETERGPQSERGPAGGSGRGSSVQLKSVREFRKLANSDRCQPSGSISGALPLQSKQIVWFANKLRLLIYGPCVAGLFDCSAYTREKYDFQILDLLFNSYLFVLIHKICLRY